MSVQNTPQFEMFLYFILVVKILYLIAMILNLYASVKGTKSQQERYENFQDKMEHLFIILMGILMVILFHPRNKGEVCISGHTKLFLYIFGILSILGIIKNFRKEHNYINTKKIDISVKKTTSI